MKKLVYATLICLIISACAPINNLLNTNKTIYIVPETDDTRLVILNTNTHIYHDQKCNLAKNCSKNCITTTKYNAKSAGAVPCQKCKGGNF